MSPPPDVDDEFPTMAERYTQRRHELDQATQTVITGAADAGRALALAGDLLRRREALGDAVRDVTLALDRIEAQATQSYVESIDADAEHGKLAHALDEAFEAILEDGDERTLYVYSAETALARRDALQSVRASMVHASLDTSKLDEKLAKIDEGLAKHARSLVAINTTRRREMATLDPSERETAWWFSARSQCDFLVSLYRLQESERVDITQKHNAAHLATCESCQRDVEAASVAYTPQHIAASSLWRREHGQATHAEITFMESHARSCKDCQRALDALAVSTADD
jgi:hypothetical protein